MDTGTLDYYTKLFYVVEVRHDVDGYFARIVELLSCMTERKASKREAADGVRESLEEEA